MATTGPTARSSTIWPGRPDAGQVLIVAQESMCFSVANENTIQPRLNAFESCIFCFDFNYQEFGTRE